MAALVLAGHDEQHAPFLAAVPPLAVEYRDASLHSLADGQRNLLVAVADDDELHTLARTVDDVVQEVHAYDHRHVTDYDELYVLRDQVAATHDDNVYEEHHASQRDVPVLVHARGDDIRSARTSAAHKDDGQTQAFHQSADYAGHEGLVAYDAAQLLVAVGTDVGYNALEKTYQGCGDQRAVDGAEEVAPAHDPHGQHQQEDVYGQVGQVGVNPRAVEHQCGHTAHASADDLVGEQEQDVAQ